MQTIQENSVLTKNQVKRIRVPEGKKQNIHTVILRYDDKCGNGHNTFSITAEGEDMFGCLHDEIAEAMPMLKPFIKWHLTSSDGPMHYIENTVFFAGDRDCWGGKKGEPRSFKFGVKGRNGKPVTDKDGKPLHWRSEEDAQTIAHQLGTEVVEVPVLFHEGKEREFDHARSAAVWPEATDEELSVSKEELTKALKKRLPKLMKEFRRDMEELGFIY